MIRITSQNIALSGAAVLSRTKGPARDRPRGSSCIIAAITFFFFTCIALNPAIKVGEDSFTLYLYWFFPLLDVSYYKSMVDTIGALHKRNRHFTIIAILMCVSVLGFGGPMSLIKVATLAHMVLYLHYCFESGLIKWFYVMICFNVAIAVVQFVGYYLIGLDFTYAIGPTAISNLIWGEYSTETFSNFYSITGGAIRVCGWSREAGFFSSLMVVAMCLAYLMESGRRRSTLIFVCLIGLAVSISKSSLMLLPLVAIIALRSYINKISSAVSLVILIAGVALVAVLFDLFGVYGLDKISISQRIGSPLALLQFDFLQWLFGAQSVSMLHQGGPIVPLLTQTSLELTGFAGTIQQVGLLGFGMLLLFLHASGIRSAGFAALFLLTITTDFLTSTSFIVLSYFCAIQLSAPGSEKCPRSDNKEGGYVEINPISEY